MKNRNIIIILVLAIIIIITFSSCAGNTQENDIDPNNSTLDESDENTNILNESNKSSDDNSGKDMNESTTNNDDNEDDISNDGKNNNEKDENNKNNNENESDIEDEIQGETIETMMSLLPERSGYVWTHNGTAEYTHFLKLDSIISHDSNINYKVSGHVEDVSSGESENNLGISLEYKVKPNVIIQTKQEEQMLDSDFDEIEIIRGPLIENNTWTQQVIDKDGNQRTLTCTIDEIQDDNGLKIYLVSYNEQGTDYYEKREIKQGVGTIAFEKSMLTDDGPFPIGYFLNYSYTGYEINIQVKNYFPPFEKELNYYGLAEYGHNGSASLQSISSTDAIISFDGIYNDGSGVEDEFTVKYFINFITGTITEQVISNTRNDIPEVNSKLHNIVVLKFPLENGNTWSHQTTINGEDKTVIAKIVELKQDGTVTVEYKVEDIDDYINNTYIERRTFSPTQGMTHFANSIKGLLVPDSIADDPAKLKEFIENNMFGYYLN